MERFFGRVAVVTGSSSGIGKEIVKEMVKRGLTVAGLARNLSNQQVRFLIFRRGSVPPFFF